MPYAWLAYSEGMDCSQHWTLLSFMMVNLPGAGCLLTFLCMTSSVYVRLSNSQIFRPKESLKTVPHV